MGLAKQLEALAVCFKIGVVLYYYYYYYVKINMLVLLKKNLRGLQAARGLDVRVNIGVVLIYHYNYIL